MERSNYFECSADQKFGYFNPHHFLVGLTKTKCPPDKNFGQPNQMAVWLSQPPQEIGSAYKIFMSVQIPWELKKSWSHLCVRFLKVYHVDLCWMKFLSLNSTRKKRVEKLLFLYFFSLLLLLLAFSLSICRIVTRKLYHRILKLIPKVLSHDDSCPLQGGSSLALSQN